MSKRRLFLNMGSIALLTVPNALYLGFNFDILKESNAIALTMTALLVFAIIGLGALAHFKANAGVWALVIGVFVLSLSNIAYVAGMALIIEGSGLAIDGYVMKPLITNAKIKEMEANGKSITFTKEIK